MSAIQVKCFPTEVKWLSQQSQVHVSHSGNLPSHKAQVPSPLLTQVKCMSHIACVFRTGKCLIQVNLSLIQVKCPCLTGLVHCAHIQVKCLPTQVKCMSPYSGRIPSHRGQVNVSPFKSNSFPQRSSECPLLPFKSNAFPQRSSACPLI